MLATRRAWTRGIDLELEGLLDRIEAGDLPPSVVGGLAERFKRPPAPGDVSPPG